MSSVAAGLPTGTPGAKLVLVAERIVVCAQPSRLPLLRRSRGHAAAGEAVAIVHERFRLALSDCHGFAVHEERLYATFASNEALRAAEIVGEVVHDLPEGEPPVSVGCALDSDDDDEPEWRVNCGSAAAAKARALAMIASNNQVLVDDRFREAAEQQGASVVFLPTRDGRNGRRELVGLPEAIDVAVLLDARAISLDSPVISNFPVLRPQLKQLEDTTAEMLMQMSLVEDSLDRYVQLQIPGHATELYLNGRLLLRWAKRALELGEAESELRLEPTIVAKIGRMRSAVTRFEGELENEAPNTEVLSSAWRAFRASVENVHRDADRLIKEGDGTREAASRRQ